LYWVTGKDFVKSAYYYKIGLIPNKKEYIKRLLKFIPLKLYYFSTIIFVPYYFSSFSFGTIIIGFLLMHFVAGLLLSIVFQLAHVVPNMEFPQADEEDNVDENWYIHQLQTTSNFSPKNKFLSWYLGGLTNQVEHHLFPTICHVHYPKISKIVEQTAKDFSVPYNVNKSFFSALSGHIKTLKALGKN
jgi:linoleoyl-CoA desaturase